MKDKFSLEEHMIEQTIERLEHLCDTIPSLLTSLTQEEYTNKREPTSWSKKEILGHLIDSATNNHQRFVRVQFEDSPTISYNQNEWNRSSHHEQIPMQQLISFWTAYNLFLIELLKHIPEESLLKTCNIGKESPVTLAWIIQDYVRHLEHHLKQIIVYN
jgi:hypothetical protein